jgi:protein required for attachment to host cells
MIVAMATHRHELSEADIDLVIVSGTRARLLTRTPAGAFRTVRKLASEAARQRSAALARDRLGRSHESVGSARHAIEPRSDPHEKAMAAFIAEVADSVNRAAASGHVHALVVAGPPAVLDTLDRALAPDLRTRIRARVGSDLAKVPDAKLPAHFPAWPLTR